LPASSALAPDLVLCVLQASLKIREASIRVVPVILEVVVDRVDLRKGVRTDGWLDRER
jgi:hypothetical protein